MLIHEAKHANIKHFANNKLQFMVPILETLLLIQLQGWNNCADFKPETVLGGEIRVVFIETWDCFTLLPYWMPY